MCAIKLLEKKKGLKFIICTANRIIRGLFHRDFIYGDYNYMNAGRFCAFKVAPKAWNRLRNCARKMKKNKMVEFYVFFGAYCRRMKHRRCILSGRPLLLPLVSIMRLGIGR